jgi:hypothetical protein
MEFGSIIDVIAGMLFVYLLLSLLCTALGEYIEAKLNNRAKLLKKGIELLLNESKGGGIDLAGMIYQHGLIRPLYRDANQLPSYIPSRTFAMALWNMATATAADGGVTNDLKTIRATVADLPNEELRTALLTLIDEANGDLARARANVEQWYDSAMDRVSGWYKRKTAYTMLALGVGMAAVLNADTINIATALSRDSTLRSAVVAAAEERIDTPPPATGATTPLASAEARDQAAADGLKTAYTDVAALGLPIGWVSTPANTEDLRQFPGSAGGWLLKLLGILLTGFAVSQGAPFWFDLLNKFMVIRSTVKPKEKSREESAK